MPTTDRASRHTRLFVLIHQQARAEYTALRLERRSRQPLDDPDRFMAMAARSWSGPSDVVRR
ncbi:hypothetical protein [Aquicoccus sp. SU-CL01552]|uniref:hypothetical protein n=1 Tax=Aquicoccus sp. SU-CL01552 TaxID=3127656 RepID=UPI003104E65B